MVFTATHQLPSSAKKKHMMDTSCKRMDEDGRAQKIQERRNFEEEEKLLPTFRNHGNLARMVLRATSVSAIFLRFLPYRVPLASGVHPANTHVG